MTEGSSGNEKSQSHDNYGYSHEKDDHHGHGFEKRDGDKGSRIYGQRDEEKDEDEVDISCGIGGLRTKCLGKWFSNLYVFTALVGLSSIFSHMIHGALHVHLPSIERQFNIDNAKAGLFDTVNKGAHLCTILIAGHFAKKAHIPMLVGMSGIGQGLLLMIPALLQLIDPYELPYVGSHQSSSDNATTDYGDNVNYLCDVSSLLVNSSGNNTDIGGHSNVKEHNEAAFIALLTVQATKGVIDTFHYSFLPMLYLDDNVLDKSKMGIFIGIQHVITDLAGPIGKQINGLLTEVPIDLKETEMDPKDRRFVAAWWLSFFVCGIGLLIFSIPLILFPRKLVSRRKRNEALKKATITFAGGQIDEEPDETNDKEEEEETNTRKPSFVGNGHHNDLIENKDKGRKFSLRERSGSQLSHLSNASSRRRGSLFPPVVGPTERKLSIDGSVVFHQPVQDKTKNRGKIEDLCEMIRDFPKAIFRLMKIPVFVILILDIAILSIPYSGIAMFRSVYMAHEYNVPMSEVTLTTGLTTALGNAIGTIFSSWLSKKVSTKTGYVWIMFGTYFSTLFLAPMYIIFGCGNENVYGAQGSIGIPTNVSDYCDCKFDRQLISCGDDGNNYLSPCHAGCTGVDGKMFTNCSMLTNITSGTSVTPGLCPTDCHDNFIIYVVLHGLQYLISAMGMIPRRLLILRLVDPRDRGFASSMFMFSYIVFGIPAPNLFGKFIDDTCLIWDDHYCTLYDRDQIRYLISGIDASVHVLIQITIVTIILIFKYEERKLNKKLPKEKEETKDMEVGEKNDKSEQTSF